MRGCSTRWQRFRPIPGVPVCNVFVKLDMTNAFNTARQVHFLEVCSSRALLILRLASTAYATSSHLVIGSETILSETCVQQGDPLGSILFAFAVDEIVRSVRSSINIWYLDDATIGGPVEIVCEDLHLIIPMLSDIGHEVNPSKSEISNVSCDIFQSVLLAIESTLPRVTVTERADLNILGAPININGCRTGVIKAVKRLSTMSSRLESIDTHHAFFLLRKYLSLPRLLFKLRNSPCYRLLSELTKFDETLRQAASTVCNVNFDRRLPRSATSISTGGFHGLQRQFRQAASTVCNVNFDRRLPRSATSISTI